MVALIEGVVNDVDPLDKAVPPEDAAYQSIVSPPAGVADIITVPAPHLDPPVPDGATGFTFTVADTAVLTAEIQPAVVFLASA